MAGLTDRDWLDTLLRDNGPRGLRLMAAAIAATKQDDMAREYQHNAVDSLRALANVIQSIAKGAR